MELKNRVADLREDRKQVLAEMQTQQELMKQEERQNAEMKMQLERMRLNLHYHWSDNRRFCMEAEMRPSPLAIEDIEEVAPLRPQSFSSRSQAALCSTAANATAEGTAKAASSRTRFLVLLEGV